MVPKKAITVVELRKAIKDTPYEIKGKAKKAELYKAYMGY
jgi:hypothetical protein